jgi:hypothetical protein
MKLSLAGHAFAAGQIVLQFKGRAGRHRRFLLDPSSLLRRIR